MKKTASKKQFPSDAPLTERSSRAFGKPQLENEYARIKQDRKELAAKQRKEFAKNYGTQLLRHANKKRDLHLEHK